MLQWGKTTRLPVFGENLLWSQLLPSSKGKMSQRNNQNSKSGASTLTGFLAAAGVGALLGYLGHSLLSESENANANSPQSHRSSNSSSVPIQPPKACVICMQELSPPLEQLPCSHLFHQSCLLLWLDKSASCPTCRCGLSGSQMDAYLRRNAA